MWKRGQVCYGEAWHAIELDFVLRVVKVQYLKCFLFEQLNALYNMNHVTTWHCLITANIWENCLESQLMHLCVRVYIMFLVFLVFFIKRNQKIKSGLFSKFTAIHHTRFSYMAEEQEAITGSYKRTKQALSLKFFSLSRFMRLLLFTNN